MGKKLFILGGVLATCFAGVLIYREFKRGEAVAVYSCLASAARALGNKHGDRIELLVGGKRTEINQGAAQALLLSAEPGDCGAYQSKDKLFVDSWGHTLVVIAEKHENDKVFFVVRSPGPDGIRGNADDISSLDGWGSN